jgi:diguanylate cyclase (GGDEF)-like protein
VVAGNYAAYASGWNLRWRDPSLTVPLVLLGVAVQLGLVAAAPQVAFPFIVNLFTVFAFGVIWMSLRASIAIWALTAAACGALMWALGARTAVPAESEAEVLLTWLCFSVILGRSLLLGVYANELRSKLAEGRRRLAASLEQIQELVHYDELTRTLNRRSLLARLEQEAGRARRTGVPFSVALLDLDHFKRVNDTYGHAIGDEVLKRFSQTVAATMRESDVFGRYGGEEFLLLLMVADPQAALAPLERIRLAVALCDWNAIAPGLELTTSIGVATQQPEESVAQLLRRADEALYEAKAAGRNRVIAKE